MEVEHYNWVIFVILVILSQLLAITVMVINAVWAGLSNGGIVFQNTALVFNLHPFAMIFGLIFFCGESLLVFRVFKPCPKILLKIIHAVLHLLGLILAAIGMAAIFQYFYANGLRHLYSVHSWLGLVLVIFYGAQWVAGFSTFLLPCCPNSFRALFIRFHVIFGRFLFLLAVIVVVSGISSRNTSNNFIALQQREMLGNFLAFVIVIYAWVVYFIVCYPNYKRVEYMTEEDIVETVVVSK